MTPKIKQRIEQLCRSEIPEGYKKTKAGILPVDWDVHMDLLALGIRAYQQR